MRRPANGHVIESGTFDELVAKGGRFAELARAQFMVQEQARASVAAPGTTSVAPETTSVAPDATSVAVKI